VSHALWNQCLSRLENELSAQQFNTWIRPLRAEGDSQELRLIVPNQFVLDWVENRFRDRIVSLCAEYSETGQQPQLTIEIETQTSQDISSLSQPRSLPSPSPVVPSNPVPQHRENTPNVAFESFLNNDYTFENFVEGKSNQLARAAAVQVAENPGDAYNPLLFYGGVGLGKTHLMHAIGHMIVTKNPLAKVAYLHSEKFVQDMVRALQHNVINEFKCYYRSLDALLIDDIQFFAGKGRSQEEFFHTFNALLEGQGQVILTCDKYPKEVSGLEERLKSRFGWGLAVSVEPPELETRVAILMSKAQQLNAHIPNKVAFFIAKHIRSNVRELEGALRRVVANSKFMNTSITVDFTKEVLEDLLALHDKLVTVENIQKTVAEYYKIRINDLLSNKRIRSFARPRQIAMALTKELTRHSLPEIGDAFGGRDHTTVLHACKKINKLRKSDNKTEEDVNNLLKTLAT